MTGFFNRHMDQVYSTTNKREKDEQIKVIQSVNSCAGQLNNFEYNFNASVMHFQLNNRYVDSII